MAVRQNRSEVIFEAYLRAHNYSWQYEPDLGVPGRPDYVISRGGSAAICEVKEFETDAIRELGAAAGGPVVVPPRLLYRTIRRQVRTAASKMRPLASRGIPIAVVLANPKRAAVMLDPRTVFHALYGLPDPQAPPPPGGLRLEAWPLPTYAGRDGILTAQYPFVSAIIVLHGPDGPVIPVVHGGPHDTVAPLGVTHRERPVFVHVIHTVSTQAVALPDELFNAPYDASWKVNDAGAMGQRSGLLRADSLLDEDTTV